MRDAAQAGAATVTVVIRLIAATAMEDLRGERGLQLHQENAFAERRSSPGCSPDLTRFIEKSEKSLLLQWKISPQRACKNLRNPIE